MPLLGRAPSVRLALLGVIVAIFVGAAVYVWRLGALPAPGSSTYEETTRAFYHGLAALEVGLLDDARQQFTSAATRVPGEPASWANLGLTQMRLGELDAAAEPIQRALALLPDNSDLVLLAARMETARGRLDEGIAGLRRAVLLDTRGLRARFALAEELTRLNTPDADKEAQTLLDELAMRAPANLAIQLERARLAAKLRDAQRLRESVEAIGRDAASWTEQAREQFAVVQKAAADGNFDDAPRATTILRNVLAPVPAFSESLIAVRTPAERAGRGRDGGRRAFVPTECRWRARARRRRCDERAPHRWCCRHVAAPATPHSRESAAVARLDRPPRLESRLPHRHGALRSRRGVPAAAERGRHFH
jgi:tetratricopeptide (TPR) repeat protein